jgi:hypothetical protein
MAKRILIKGLGNFEIYRIPAPKKEEIVQCAESCGLSQQDFIIASAMVMTEKPLPPVWHQMHAEIVSEVAGYKPRMPRAMQPDHLVGVNLRRIPIGIRNKINEAAKLLECQAQDFYSTAAYIIASEYNPERINDVIDAVNRLDQERRLNAEKVYKTC